MYALYVCMHAYRHTGMHAWVCMYMNIMYLDMYVQDYYLEVTIWSDNMYVMYAMYVCVCLYYDFYHAWNPLNLLDSTFCQDHSFKNTCILPSVKALLTNAYHNNATDDKHNELWQKSFS